MENEIWVDVLDYEGLYQVSDLGRVKSLGRQRIMPNGGIRTYPEKILNLCLLKTKYLCVSLCKNGINKTHRINRLVWESFNGKTDLQVDHKIEGNKLDNRLCNLQVLTPRENSSKKILIKKSSKYIGVCYDLKNNKWKSQITINKKIIHIGYFENELDASNAYKEQIKNITEPNRINRQ